MKVRGQGKYSRFRLKQAGLGYCGGGDVVDFAGDGRWRAEEKDLRAPHDGGQGRDLDGIGSWREQAVHQGGHYHDSARNHDEQGHKHTGVDAKSKGMQRGEHALQSQGLCQVEN